MKNLEKTQRVILILVIPLIIVFFAQFMVENRNRVIENNQSYIEDITVQNVRAVNSELKQGERLIRDLSRIYGSKSFRSEEEKLALLQDLSSDTSFDYIELISKDGKDISTAGGTADVSDRRYYRAAMKGKTGIEVVKHSKITDETLLIFYTPVESNGNVTEVLTGVYTEKHLQNTMKSNVFGKEAEGYVVNADGDILFGTKKEDKLNIFDKLAVEMKEYSPFARKLKTYVKRQDTVSFRLDMKKGLSTGTVVPIGQSDWVLFQILPAEITGAMLNSANRSGIILMLELLAVFIVLVRMITVINRNRRKVLQMDKERMEAILSTIPALLTEEKAGTGLITFLGNSEGVFDIEPGTSARKELLHQFVHREDREKFKELDRRLKNGETKVSADLRMQDATGDYIWVEYILFSLGDERGQWRETLGVVYNIDRQVRRNRENIRNAGSFFKMYQTVRLVNLNDSTYESLRGHLPSSEKQTGSYPKLCEAFVQQYVDGEEQERVRKFLSQESIREHISPESPVLECEFQMQQPAKRWGRANILLVSMEEKRVSQVMLAIADITAQKQSEIYETRRLRQALESSIHINKAKSRFIAKLSRKLRVPLGVIVGMTDLAGDSLRDDDSKDREKTCECLEKISAAAAQMESMIGEALDVSKIESGRMNLTEHPFSLRSLLCEVTEEVQEKADRKAHTFRTDFSEIVHEQVIGDEIRLKQVFMNLLSNAVNYTLRKGVIELTVKERKIGITDMACYLITVKDNGIGMTEEFCTRIFEPFSRAQDIRTENVDGAGLGMVAVKNIVKGMGGKIAVKTHPNEGTEVMAAVYLKLQENREDGAAAFGSGEQSSLQGKHVLLIESDKMSREVITGILRPAGVQIDICADGAEVMKNLNRTAFSAYDLILLDSHLPDASSYEILLRIRSGQSGAETVPVIALMESDTAEEISKAKLAGINDYLMKPVDRRDLMKLLKAHLSFHRI